MGVHRQEPHLTANARALRARQTKAEALLWRRLRGRRLQRLKFRRQFPIAPFVVDFACVERRLIVELDGVYHDYVFERDHARQSQLEAAGWMVIRFRNEDVIADVDAVATAIVRSIGLDGEA